MYLGKNLLNRVAAEDEPDSTTVSEQEIKSKNPIKMR